MKDGKYEEALERAKELHEAGNTLTKLQMEIVFPELKQSEDERIRTRLIALVEAFGQGEYKNEMLAYLERQKEQQPAEWSKKDEQYLLVCKNALNKYQRSDHWDANIISKWLEERLKSIRPQPQWKPSEEQMEALKDAFRKDGGNEYHKVINSLYHDLQKLL